MEILQELDIMRLNKIKTPRSVSLPGYVSYVSPDASKLHHGSTFVLIKQHLKHK